jgi:hypothetical protein
MKRKITITLSSLLFIVAFWFLGVDCSWFVETCPDCLFGRDIIQVRVLTIPIYQRTQVSETLLSKIAADVGAECQHPKLTRWHKARYWGLIICACPCIGGIHRMGGGDEWYDDKARLIVKDMAKNNPSLRDEITERVFKNHDWEYWKAFLYRVRTLRDGKSAITP